MRTGRPRKRTIVACAGCRQPFEIKLSDLARGRSFCSRTCSNAHQTHAKHDTPAHRAQCIKNLGARMSGKRHSQEAKDKIRAANLGRPRPQTGHVKSGLVTRLRNSLRYHEWRDAVFARDDYTCQECGYRKGKIHADHTVAFSILVASWLREQSSAPDAVLLLRAFECDALWQPALGRTLCIPCHKNTSSYLNRWHTRAVSNYLEEIGARFILV